MLLWLLAAVAAVAVALRAGAVKEWGVWGAPQTHAQREAALDYARFAAGLAAQSVFAQHHGQPARRECWEDAAINARFGGCYRDTRATMEQCWIRPRYDGYLAFQEAGGDLIESHLRGALGEDALLDRLARLHAEVPA